MLEDLEAGDKLRRLLALEIHRIVEDLELRRSVLLELWGRTRDRGMFLDTVFSRWATLGFPDLLALEPQEVVLVDTFYRELHELRFYFRFTEDMPVTLSDTYDVGLIRLKGYGELVVEAFGGPPDRPMIEFPEDEPSSEEPTGLFALEDAPEDEDVEEAEEESE